jgi:vitamin B12 transporter
MLDDVERIEVLKGPASSVYGSSAMGGVVNIVTRESRGTIAGSAQFGLGSFGTRTSTARAGGAVAQRIDFDVVGTWLGQDSDFRMGNGEIRPATTYGATNGSLRMGTDIGSSWRLNGRFGAYRGRDIMTPGDLASGINAQGRKNQAQGTADVRLSGRWGKHAMTAVVYRTAERAQVFNVRTGNPLDAPYLPYVSFESDLRWSGAQLRDAWTPSPRTTIVVGADYDLVTAVTRSYTPMGDRTAPFAADNTRRTLGVYAEHSTKWRDGRTVVSAGVRFDRITSSTLATPFKGNFRPSESTFEVFTPGLGMTHEVAGGLRIHGSIGRAFVPADASLLTGFTSTVIGGRTQIAQGNPGLRPERSVGVDAGLEWTAGRSRVDVTAFRTVVQDRFITNVVISNPPAPAPVVVSVQNGLDAHMVGAEVDAEARLGHHVGVFANATHLFTRRERLVNGKEQDILNVGQTTLRAGVDVDLGRLAARLGGRFVGGRKDNDFNAPGFPIIDYDNATVVDLVSAYRLGGRQWVTISASNLLDAYYYEKLGFPLPGRALAVSYRIGF